MTGFIAEYWQYIMRRKKFWLAPVVFFLLLSGGLIILTEGTALAPFIYTMF